MRIIALNCVAVVILTLAACTGKTAVVVDGQIKTVLSQPEFRDAHWGIEFYDIETDTVLYALNTDEMFSPASTVKIFTSGTS